MKDNARYIHVHGNAKQPVMGCSSPAGGFGRTFLVNLLYMHMYMYVLHVVCNTYMYMYMYIYVHVFPPHVLRI